jgi:hypothetical protein
MPRRVMSRQGAWLIVGRHPVSARTGIGKSIFTIDGGRTRIDDMQGCGHDLSSPVNAPGSAILDSGHPPRDLAWKPRHRLLAVACPPATPMFALLDGEGQPGRRAPARQKVTTLSGSPRKQCPSQLLRAELDALLHSAGRFWRPLRCRRRVASSSQGGRHDRAPTI